MQAKIFDTKGDLMPISSHGELYVAGLTLRAGYWRNEKITAEVMRTDEAGVLLMHAGDEAMFDSKDMR